MSIWPSTNEWGIPDLLLSLQGSIEPPVTVWGSIGRGRSMGGTWVFFTDDSRFAALVRNPLPVPQSRCKHCGELNLSLFDQSSPAEALWATYRKRCVSRAWQDRGLGILVDLNVPARHREVCMLGVPAGWRSFATRGYRERLDELVDELRFSREWGGTSAVTLVYGGGKQVEQVCREHPGAVWIPDQTTQKHRRRDVQG